MAKEKQKEETFLELEISFPKAPKKAKDKTTLFDKLLSLVEESKESLPVEVKSYKKRRHLILDSEEFRFDIFFGKRGSIVRTRALVHTPEKNLDIANEVGNKVISYMNTILGEGATGSRVMSEKTILYPKKTINLSRKIIGEGKIAKINEKVKRTLSPVGVFFEYKVNERDFSFATFSNKKAVEALLSSITYKDKMPFDLLRTEHNKLSEPAGVVKKLIEEEL